jgi:hypothetical protein
MKEQILKIIENNSPEVATEEILQLITDNNQALQLLQTGVSGSSLKPSDLIEFAKWINDKGYSHRLKILPNDLIDFYLQNKENIIKVNSENCH